MVLEDHHQLPPLEVPTEAQLLETICRMPLDELPLLVVEPSRVIQYVGGDVPLAEIVQQSAGGDVQELTTIVDTQPDRQNEA